MTAVKILAAIGGHNVGDTLDTSPDAATYLIEAGYAEAQTSTKGRPKAAPKGTEPTEPTPQGGTPSEDGQLTAG